jgi:hypothetical protein
MLMGVRYDALQRKSRSGGRGSDNDDDDDDTPRKDDLFEELGDYEYDASSIFLDNYYKNDQRQVAAIAAVNRACRLT